MKIALATTVGDAETLLDRHIAFHLAAGAHVIIVCAPAALDLEAWGERVHHVQTTDPTELARLAVAEHGADWVIPSRADEFWWPRGESLVDVLGVVPPRYSVVQALVREFVDEARSPDEATVRTSFRGPGGAGGAPVEQLLRPVYRAEPEMIVDPVDWTLRGLRVPLRAWYPLEVMRFSAEPAVAPADVEGLLTDGTLVHDTRLRDVLRGLGASQGEVDVAVLPVPNVVDDASYAIECAAVGEVDLVGLDRQIRELEQRIAALEARFWPTVRRHLRRLARRPS